MTQYKAIGVKHTAITEGKVYELTKDMDGYNFVDDDGDERWVNFRDNTHCERFELMPAVSDGPVRTETVTKRRIVPGVYGRVQVNGTNPLDPKQVDLGFVYRGAATGEDKTSLGHCLTATELDELAMVASQLAEALRDGK